MSRSVPVSVPESDGIVLSSAQFKFASAQRHVTVQIVRLHVASCVIGFNIGERYVGNIAMMHDSLGCQFSGFRYREDLTKVAFTSN